MKLHILLFIVDSYLPELRISWLDLILWNQQETELDSVLSPRQLNGFVNESISWLAENQTATILVFDQLSQMLE